MRFALIGDHPDGVAFAQALIAAGHECAAWCGVGSPPIPATRSTADLEDILADPAITACIVASMLGGRLDVARRVLQSERHAAVVHPVELKPDGAYELNMLQGDVHQALVPLLPEGLTSAKAPEGWIDAEFEVLQLAIDDAGKHASFPGWTLLRRLGGEIAEVSAFARREQVEINEPVMVSALFADGRTCRVVYRHRRFIEVNERELHLPPPDWAGVVAEFERAIDALTTTIKADPAAGGTAAPGARLSWLDAIRAHELDDAAVRSLARRRTTLLEYQEANEEVGFKGTMTLVGCAMLWVLLGLLVVSAFFPRLFWLLLPILLVFLALQLLRWVAGSKPDA